MGRCFFYFTNKKKLTFALFGKRKKDMKILVVAATAFEIAPLLAKKETLQFDALVTGVGQMPTAFHVGNALQQQPYDLVINAGIAGSFRRDWELGKVVHVVSEQYGDLGIEFADGSFKDMFEMGFMEKDVFPYENGRLFNATPAQYDFLDKANGLTINKVHGFEPSIDRIRQLYDCDIETMEGTGFFYACLMHKVPFLAIRSISNYVEKRNREAWNIGLAIQNLNSVLEEILVA
jgi:futalosine hydrolase